MVRLRFAVLADYAALGQNAKPLVVGIWDNITNFRNANPVPMPRCFLFAALNASVADGTEHTVEIRLVDGDGTRLIDPILFPLRFGILGPGRGLAANINLELVNLALPGEGDYEFQFWLGPQQLGEVAFSVLPAPPQA